MKKISKRLIATALLLTATIVWGAAFPIIKPGLQHMTPFQFLFYRYLFTLPFSIPYILYQLYNNRKIISQLKVFTTITLLELIGTVGYLSILYFGLQKTTSIETSLISATMTIFIVIGGVIFLKEKEQKNELLGLILAVIGTITLTLEPILLGKNALHSLSFTGNLLVLTANILGATYYILAKKHYKNLPKLFITSISFIIGLIVFLILALIEGDPRLFVNLTQPSVVIASAYMGIFGSIIGLTAYIAGQNLIEASEASLFSYLQPLIAIPIAMIFLGETLTWPMILAIILISGGVILAQIRMSRATAFSEQKPKL